MSATLSIPATDDFDTLGVEGTARLVGTLFDDLAKNLVRISRAVAWLDEHGFDISIFENRMGRGDLRAIADGLIEPEVWLRLGNQRKLLKSVSALPREVQKKLVGGMPVEVAERAPDGTATVRKVAIETLPSELIPQVFDGPRLRPVAEQIAASMRPLDRPTIVEQAPDYEALIARASVVTADLRTANGKRERKRLASELRELAEKIALLVA